MTHPPIPQRRTGSRTAVLFGLVLLVSNMATALVGWYAVQALDHDYTAAIGAEMPLLADLRSLTQGSASVQRYFVSLLLTDDAEERRLLVQLVQRSRETNTITVERIARHVADPTGQRLLTQLRAQRANYITLSGDFQRLALEDQREAALQLKRTRLGPEFEAYQRAITALARHLELTAEASSSQLSAEAKQRGWYVLGLGVWPLAFAAVFLAVAAFLALWFRREIQSVTAGSD